MTDREYNYIIVGAGSAGCVLANRLSANPANRVLLIEAGGSDKNLMIKMPTALSFPMANPKYNWGYNAQPEPTLNDRTISCPRGRAMGGSSSINGMVYVRGHALDFDEWEQAGAKGWSYQSCLPYFKKAETWMDGEDTYRGGNGPMGVCNGNKMKNPLYTAFIRAGDEAGYGTTEDYNGYRQEGFGPMHMTVRGGVRESTSRAYLDPVKSRGNLDIIDQALVQKLILNGKKVVGVQFERNGKTASIMTSGEVVLSAGAIGSPAILQMSGIGPKKVLNDAGVDQVHELPGVGENLQDHLEVYFQFRCKQNISLNNKLGLFAKALIGIRWVIFKTGLGATNHFESCAFIRSKPGIRSPDIQYHFLPGAIRYDGTPSIKGHGFQVHVGPNKPKSRGHIRIVSPNALDAPKITFNYLTQQTDVSDWRACIRLTREIMSQPGMDPYRGDEIQPGIEVQSNDEIDEWVRNNVESAYHPSGTCKMGATDDPMTVVDPDCRVIGIEGLRVVDASIFPSITNGNLNAPIIMIAEKASDIILGKDPLPNSNVDVWIAPDWQTRQREGDPIR
ncbi:MAG: choline dehydrogenase [Acidimicrobiales bacterium]|nr:MAG: choline dehydrogenase [Acidimicrobiales bacterium]